MSEFYLAKYRHSYQFSRLSNRFSDLDVILSKIIKNNVSPEIARLVFIRLVAYDVTVVLFLAEIVAPPVILLPSVLILLRYFRPYFSNALVYFFSRL